MQVPKPRCLVAALLVSLAISAVARSNAQTQYLPGPDSQNQSGVPKGDIFTFNFISQK